MNEAIVVALIVASGQIIQALLHRKHERVTRDTNKQLTAYLNGGKVNRPNGRGE